MTTDAFSNCYRHTRNTLAKRYNKPELKQVQLYDFRRHKASKTYHLTGKLLIVKELLGHKDIRSTERYISLFDEQNITWIPVIAETDEEIKQAIQDDCILVCQANGKTYFKNQPNSLFSFNVNKTIQETQIETRSPSFFAISGRIIID